MELKDFEFQKWPVYQTALETAVEAYGICDELPRESATGLRDQLRRAVQSVPLNIAEGSSRYTARDKAQFFRIARGSVFECVAILDLVRKLRLVECDFELAYKKLETIGRMLSGLINYVESDKYKRGNPKSASRT